MGSPSLRSIGELVSQKLSDLEDRLNPFMEQFRAGVVPVSAIAKHLGYTDRKSFKEKLIARNIETFMVTGLNGTTYRCISIESVYSLMDSIEHFQFNGHNQHMLDMIRGRGLNQTQREAMDAILEETYSLYLAIKLNHKLKRKLNEKS